MASTIPTSQLPKMVQDHQYFCDVRRNVLRTTKACYPSLLLWPAGCRLSALVSLLFHPRAKKSHTFFCPLSCSLLIFFSPKVVTNNHVGFEPTGKPGYALTQVGSAHELPIPFGRWPWFFFCIFSAFFLLSKKKSRILG